MGGLTLAERYFARHGLPLLREKFQPYEARIAAGLVGDGSDCLGFDDELSMDHDWGPGLCLWLAKPDHDEIGQALQREYESLPKTFEGFERSTSEWGGGRVGVFETGAFYRGFLGRLTVPETSFEWLRIPEKNLAACTSGKVFHDPLGEFSGMRQQLLAFYPDDVRIAKIAARCMSAGQSGQYNFLRCLQRQEYFAAQYAETKFCTDMMSLVYLLNRKYAPYYKWMHRGIADLPRMGYFLFGKIAAMTATRDQEEKKSIIDEICAAAIQEIQAEELSDSISRFLVDHGPVVHKKIRDAGLRKLNVWIG